ncbi:MAG: CsgG/HfaB family protein [candidate division KSB1 bacterium]|nr:CsgG/HfaB family protein [candidate division KSB1 bacterium]MDZ7295509.1 CsgG/HfaB family protein [candidate division KSB1 bacterium]MDZ7386637.1 CsgG/HfaB family protein [candidate division KSB1 bacterium]MDZ7392728.1 CsgG/HfaB family protein [candidate division KSB1 bacterium]MDZ7413199.1 CsgG/HfaB family protein [candidate division KSB1 bacterium]
MRIAVKSLTPVLIALLSCVGQHVWGQQERTLAVLYFQNNSLAQKDEVAALSKGLADMFITELSKVQALRVIERAQLQQLLEEMKLAQAGLIDEKSAVQVGRLLGAKHLLLGSFVHMFGGKMRIDARIVEVETGLTIKAEEETGKVDKLFDMVKRLTEKIVRDLDVALTREDRVRLEAGGEATLEAALLYAKGLELEDRGQPLEAYKMYRKALAVSPSFAQAKQRLMAVQVHLK